MLTHFLTVLAWVMLPFLILWALVLLTPGRNNVSAVLAWLAFFLLDVSWLVARYLC